MAHDTDNVVARLAEKVLTSGGTDQEISVLADLLRQSTDLAPLRRLLHSADESSRYAGAWIASELGIRSGPLLEELVTIAHDPSKRIRFFALDALHACIDSDPHKAIRTILGCGIDSEPAIRWKVMRILVELPRHRLESAGQLPLPSRDAIALLDASVAEPELIAALVSDDPMLRLCAVVAAARSPATQGAVLRAAAESTDSAVRNFAVDTLNSVGQ